GYSLGGADLLRRAMGKKKVEEMAAQRAIFKAGAAKKGLAAAKADQLFDLMEKFAGYGVNKSHAAAHALRASQTAYMKANPLAARDGGAHPFGLVRLGRAQPRAPPRLARSGDRGGRTQRAIRAADEPLRRRAGRSRIVRARDVRALGGTRAAAEREAEPRLLP